MAANKTSRPKRKDRKNVEYGVAHIRSTFNNTIVTITDKMVMLYPGLVLVDLVSEVLEKALHLQLKWQQKLQQKQQWNMV